MIFLFPVTSIRSEESSENVHVSGSFRVAAEGEELPRSAGTQQERRFIVAVIELITINFNLRSILPT